MNKNVSDKIIKKVQEVYTEVYQNNTYKKELYDKHLTYLSYEKGQEWVDSNLDEEVIKHFFQNKENINQANTRYKDILKGTKLEFSEDNIVLNTNLFNLVSLGKPLNEYIVNNQNEGLVDLLSKTVITKQDDENIESYIKKIQQQNTTYRGTSSIQELFEDKYLMNYNASKYYENMKNTQSSYKDTAIKSIMKDYYSNSDNKILKNIIKPYTDKHITEYNYNEIADIDTFYTQISKLEDITSLKVDNMILESLYDKKYGRGFFINNTKISFSEIMNDINWKEDADKRYLTIKGMIDNDNWEPLLDKISPAIPLDNFKTDGKSIDLNTTMILKDLSSLKWVDLKKINKQDIQLIKEFNLNKNDINNFTNYAGLKSFYDKVDPIKFKQYCKNQVNKEITADKFNLVLIGVMSVAAITMAITIAFVPTLATATFITALSIAGLAGVKHVYNRTVDTQSFSDAVPNYIKYMNNKPVDYSVCIKEEKEYIQIAAAERLIDEASQKDIAFDKLLDIVKAGVSKNEDLPALEEFLKVSKTLESSSDEKSSIKAKNAEEVISTLSNKHIDKNIYPNPKLNTTRSNIEETVNQQKSESNTGILNSIKNWWNKNNKNNNVKS